MKAVKKRLAALAVGAVLVLGMLCSFAVPHVYAIEERRAEVIMHLPSLINVSHHVGVELGWEGDGNDKLVVGYNVNPNMGYYQVNGCIYKEFHMNKRTMDNIWAVAYFVDADGRVYVSNINMFTGIGNSSIYPIVGYFNTDVTTSHSEPISTYGEDFYCTIAYKGECKDLYTMIPKEDVPANTVNWQHDGVTFTVAVTHETVTVTSTAAVKYNVSSTTLNGFAAFGFSFG